MLSHKLLEGEDALIESRHVIGIDISEFEELREELEELEEIEESNHNLDLTPGGSGLNPDNDALHDDSNLLTSSSPQDYLELQRSRSRHPTHPPREKSKGQGRFDDDDKTELHPGSHPTKRADKQTEIKIKQPEVQAAQATAHSWPPRSKTSHLPPPQRLPLQGTPIARPTRDISRPLPLTSSSNTDESV